MARSLDRALWQRVSAILDRAIELPPAARTRYIEEACGGDADLRVYVDELLSAADAPADFLGRPAAEQAASLVASSDPDASPTLIGRTIGAYRLVRELGEGGMGIVYLAERADGHFEQQVAIKLLKHGLPGVESRRRFLAERQLLAELQHPAIARLLDGGVSSDGAPYFVMECVEGQPITTHCRLNALDLDHRLQIFLDVCEAVQYAHQHLIVHRDLKPSNILVDTIGRVKLLDFGIAKLLAGDGAPPKSTHTMARVMTPEYAAPEQVRGDSVSTSTDVYALGVLLYELLTGERPYRVRTGTIGAVERAILDQEPTLPSARLSRSADVQNDRRRLRGDLDRIVLKALAKEPDRRYVSAEALASDIRRHLEGLPVTAQGDALSYRARKFVRRHRIAVSAAALILISLLGGLVATTWQARRAQIARREAERQRARAERRVADLRALINTFLFDVHDALVDLPGGTTTRKLVASKAREYLDGLAEDAGSDVGLQGELANAYERVGDGALRSSELPDAVGSYARAIAIRRRLLQANLGDRSRSIALGVSLTKLGDASRIDGRTDEAIALYREAVAVEEQALSVDVGPGGNVQPEMSGSRRLLDASERLCDELAARPPSAAALISCRRRLALVEQLLKADPSDVGLRDRRLTSATRLATLLRAAGEPDQARQVEIEVARASREIGSTYAITDPLVGVWKRRLKPSDNTAGNMAVNAVSTVRVEARLNALSFTYFNSHGDGVISFALPVDGGPAPMFGPQGQRLGTMYARRVDPWHGESWGDGLPYIYERSTISPDGRTWTSEARMKAPNGREYLDIDIWDRQAETSTSLASPTSVASSTASSTSTASHRVHR